MTELTTGAHRAELVPILVAVKKTVSVEKTNRPESRETDKEKVAQTLSQDEGLNQRYSCAAHFRAARKRDTLTGRSRGIPSRSKTIFVDLQAPQIPLQVLLKSVDRERQVLVGILKTSSLSSIEDSSGVKLALCGK